MIIQIHDAELAEHPMLSAVLAHALRFANAESCVIYVNKRVPLDAPDYRNPGWLEYGLSVSHKGVEHPLYIGCIQRRPGEEFEFHS